MEIKGRSRRFFKSNIDAIGIYLRCIGINRKRKLINFDEVKCTIGQKLTSFKARSLSTACKIVLITSSYRYISPNTLWIGLNFPNQSANILIVPIGISSGKRIVIVQPVNIRLYTLGWDKICRPQSEGSLGIRKLKMLMRHS